jgi:hypothetical protein
MKYTQYIPYALAALLLYAGVIKISNPALFQLQMSKSPLLPASLIPFISYALPIAEITIALFLFTGILKRLSLYASFTIMSLFTAYLSILYLLFKGADLPCSCGGILGKMSYPTHIAFNLFFTLLAGLAVVSSDKDKHSAELLA